MRKLEENIRGHRGELFGNDLNVYRALVSGQLEETLPDMREYATRHSRKIRRWCLSDREIKIVVSAYRTYNGIAAEAARHLPYSTFTFLKYWKLANLKIRKWKLDETQIKEVNMAYKTYKGNAKEAARHLPYSTFTFLRCWREAVFKIRGQGKYYL